MFTHPGRKLKIIAVAIFFIFTILGAFAGLFYSAANNSPLLEQSQAAQVLLGDFNPAKSVVSLIGGLIGMFVGWINSIVLYAFGALVDDVEQIKVKLR